MLSVYTPPQNKDKNKKDCKITFSDSSRSSSPTSDIEKITNSVEGIIIKSNKASKKKIVKRARKQKQPKIKGHKVAILSHKHPEEFLSREQLILLKEAILKNVEKQANQELKPSFHNLSFELGWLLIYCADINTVVWLKNLIASLKPWTNANLITTEEENIPSGQLFIGNFPHTGESHEEMLRFFKAQNAGLNTEIWKVHVTEQKRKRKGQTLSFLVDPHSAKQLKIYNYKLNYKFGVVDLRPGKLKDLEKIKREQAKNQDQIPPEVFVNNNLYEDLISM